MRSASAAPDGAIAPTRRGDDIQDRKNDRKSLGMRTPASWFAPPEIGGETDAVSRERIATALRCARRMRIESTLPDRRQRHSEAGATVWSVGHRDVAAMQMHDLAHHVESEAGAAVERRQPIEGLEDLFALIGRNAGAF